MSNRLPANDYPVFIFDLDDTLVDTYGQLVPPARREMCKAMIQSGLKGDESKCYAACQDYDKNPFPPSLVDFLINQFGTTPSTDIQQLKQVAYESFYERKVTPPLKPFPGVLPFLEEQSKHRTLYLVTSGHPPTQMQKVNLLDIASFFSRIFYVNTDQTKGEVFQNILQIHNVPPQAIVCIGDRLDHEIKIGIQLGFTTCWMRRGEHKHRPTNSIDKKPDYEISEICELIDLCK